MNNKGFRIFQEEIQQKIRNLLAEFVDGKISNEQFNILYERFNNQLELALGVLEEDNTTHDSDVTTIGLRAATTGKAIGLAIYHHLSASIIEILGQFNLDADFYLPIVRQYNKKNTSKKAKAPIVRKLSSELWVVFMAHHLTVAIVIFKNEAAPQQIRELERLLGDFETANHHLLNQSSVDTEQLAEPFIGFVRKKLES